ncbi:hypothetical protein PG993_002517 [Apiospora rasikravindrae]|uniref:F-box domain-containing protein n=1 Tax=Apiospora rasikravindrae TaxID=990691 RepID=A0ABR1TX16_9PEZI
MASRLSAELLQIIFSDVAGAPRNHTRYEHRIQERIQDLLSCALVCRAWRYEAQRALEAVILITNRKQLVTRLTSRWAARPGVRQIIIAQRWHVHGNRGLDLHDILDCSMPQLQSLVLREGITLQNSNQLRPTERVNLAALRELTLAEHGPTGYWQPLLLSLPRLQHLHLSQLNWKAVGNLEQPPFSLTSLEISHCDMGLGPLQWLVAKSAESLCSLSVEGLQQEWDTFIHLSAMRAGGLLPKVRHLSFSGPETAHSSYSKVLPKKVTDPLACWGGIESTYIRAGDAKMRSAIINGIAAISPPPVIELDASQMQFHDLKAVFRTRKAKLQPETVLRLTTELDYRSTWGYWSDEYAEDAQDLAQMNGVVLEMDKVPHHA